ncbi:hypothetical protein V6N13_016044 [Hibiscus sabdariffa]
MEDRSQSMPVEQANQVDKMKQVGAMVAWQENELWEDPKVIANSIVVGCTVATLNQHRTRLAAEGSTTEILFRNVSKKKCRQSAILKEATSTFEFGKLLGVKTIGQEDVIV